MVYILESSMNKPFTHLQAREYAIYIAHTVDLLIESESLVCSIHYYIIY